MYGVISLQVSEYSKMELQNKWKPLLAFVKNI